MQQISSGCKLSSLLNDALFVDLVQPTESNMCTTTLPQLCLDITKLHPKNSTNNIYADLKFDVTYEKIVLLSNVTVISQIEMWKVLML